MPAHLAALIDRMLARDASARPSSARAVIATLKAIERPESDKIRSLDSTVQTVELTSLDSRPTGKRRRKIVAALSLAILGLLVWAAGPAIYQIATGKGLLVIEIDDPNLEVVVRQGGAVVHDRTMKREFTLKAVGGEIEVYEKDGIKLQTRKFELTRGGKTRLRVTSEAVARQAPKPVVPKKHQPDPLENDGKRFRNRKGMVFVLVPAGAFWMGGEKGKAGDRQVHIPHDFYLGAYEVTQAQWREVMGTNPSFFAKRNPDHIKGLTESDLNELPVEGVSWNTALQFLDLLNRREGIEGWTYRLPTDAEWEYACRGAATSKEECSYSFYFDVPTNQFNPSLANFSQSKWGRTAKVGSHPPNRLGLYDMHGNVCEWCEDDETAPAKETHILRGGAFNGSGWNCSASWRYISAPSPNSHKGFRIALVPSSRIGKKVKD